MIKQIVLDTNTFLRFLLNDIPQQADAVEKLFKQAQRGKVILFVPQIALFEIVFALDKYYHFSKTDIGDKIKAIITRQYLAIQDRELFNKAIECFLQQKISLADCFLIAFAEQKDAEVFTFDKDLQKTLRRVK